MWRRRSRAVWPSHATVQEAIRYLASACDGASRRDGHGFSSDHVQAGHWLAQVPDDQWGRNEQQIGLQLVRIYRGQLHRAGFDTDVILRRKRPRRASGREIERLEQRWAADPTGLYSWRWWNGARWTEFVHNEAATLAGPLSAEGWPLYR